MTTSIESYLFACRPPSGSVIGRLERHRNNLRDNVMDYRNRANLGEDPAQIAASIAADKAAFDTLYARLQAIDDDPVRRQRLIDGLPVCVGGNITRAMIVAEIQAQRNALNALAAAPLSTAQEIVTACNTFLTAIPAYDRIDNGG